MAVHTVFFAILWRKVAGDARLVIKQRTSVGCSNRENVWAEHPVTVEVASGSLDSSSSEEERPVKILEKARKPAYLHMCVDRNRPSSRICLKKSPGLMPANDAWLSLEDTGASIRSHIRCSRGWDETTDSLIT